MGGRNAKERSIKSDSQGFIFLMMRFLENLIFKIKTKEKLTAP